MVGYRIHDRMQYMGGGGISILGNDLTPVCHAVDFVLFFFFTPTANFGFIFFSSKEISGRCCKQVQSERRSEACLSIITLGFRKAIIKNKKKKSPFLYSTLTWPAFYLDLFFLFFSFAHLEFECTKMLKKKKSGDSLSLSGP